MSVETRPAVELALELALASMDLRSRNNEVDPIIATAIGRSYDF